jgi:hypothetical protein
MDEFEEYCLRVFEHLNPRSMFLAISGYQNNFGEVSDFQVVFHSNYFNAVRKTLKTIQKYTPKAHDCVDQGFDLDHLRDARKEMIYSLNLSLKGEYDPDFIHPYYTCAGVYAPVKGRNGRNIRGVILHKRTKTLHIHGLKVNKRIVKTGSYGKRARKPMTLAKRWLKKGTPLENWRQFKLLPGRFKKLAVQREVIVG